ncbi:MAG: hypothetical protein IKG82_06440 [Oscillospiraceae bacterium]|nr:hypothetical protein [Oscillospiraceae bacterium]
MSTLLKTNFRRYFTHPVFHAALLVSAVLGFVEGRGILRGFTGRMHGEPDCFLFLFLLFAQAAVLAAVIPSQYRDGIFRLKTVAGHTKGSIYLAELLAGLTVSVLLFAVFGILTGLSAYRALKEIPLHNLLGGTGMLLLIFLTAAALLILLCTGIRRQIPALLLCTGGMFLLFFSGYICNDILYPCRNMLTTMKLTDDPDLPDEPLDTYQQRVVYIHLPASSGVHWNDADILVNRDGVPVDTDGNTLGASRTPVSRTENNIKYTGGPLRTVLTVTDTLNPLRPLYKSAAQFECVSRTGNSDDVPEYYAGERDWQLALLPKYLPVQLSAFALYCFAGWLLFRRKELN